MLLVGGLFLVLGQSMLDAAAEAMAAAVVAACAVAGAVAEVVAAGRRRLGDVMIDVDVAPPPKNVGRLIFEYVDRLFFHY